MIVPVLLAVATVLFVLAAFGFDGRLVPAGLACLAGAFLFGALP